MRIESADRRRIAVAAAVTLLALPLLIKENHGASREGGVAAVLPAGVAGAARQISAAEDSGSTIATTVPEVGGSGWTGEGPPPTAAPSNGQPTGNDRFEDGRATFHTYDRTAFGTHSCSHATLPYDTTITITNTDSGRSTWCVVRSRSVSANRVIDLDAPEFAQIADLASGVVPVRITW
jgi:hypothetical protein